MALLLPFDVLDENERVIQIPKLCLSIANCKPMIINNHDPLLSIWKICNLSFGRVYVSSSVFSLHWHGYCTKTILSVALILRLLCHSPLPGGEAG